MAAALRQMTDTAGHVPLIGDDDGGELFPIDRHAPDDVRPTLAWAAALLNRPELEIGPVPESALWLTAAQQAALGRVPERKREHEYGYGDPGLHWLRFSK